MKDNNFPIFSIIIPTYNHGHLIGRCLNSLITQTYRNWEAIIVNNYSEDNTIEIVSTFNDPRIKLINFHNNGIIGASRNKGVNNAIAEWICFLDSDDWWHSRKLEICLNYLDRYNIIYHDLKIYSKGKYVFSRKLYGRKLKGNPFIDLLVNGNAINNSSVVVNKELFLNVGGISENKELVLVEDYDCWLRISMIDNKFCYIPESLGNYWIGNNASTAFERVILAEKLVLNKFLYLIEKKYRRQAIINLNYRLGKYYYNLNKFDRAIISFKKALSNKSVKRKFKCFSFIFISYLKNWYFKNIDIK